MRLIIFVFLLLPFQLPAQQEDAIAILKEELKQSTGAASIPIALELTKALNEQASHEQAIQYARLAYQRAEESSDTVSMAEALNFEAASLFAIQPPNETNHTLAQQKLNQSQQLLQKYHMNEAKVAQKNIVIKPPKDLKELKEESVDISKILGAAWDSVVAVIESLDEQPSKIVLSHENIHDPKQQVPDSGHQPPSQDTDYGLGKEFIENILQMNKKKMEWEIKRLVELEKQDSIHLKGITIKDLSDLGKLWDVEKENLEQSLIVEEERIRKLNDRDAKEQLLIAEYKSKYDSLAHQHTVDSLSLAKQEAELAQRETELDRKQLQQQLSAMVSGGSSILFLLFLFGYFRVRKSNKILSKKNKQIAQEQERSEELLLNILPAEVADELKIYGAAQAHQYDNVSVLFADFQDFSLIADTMSPEQLVSELDYCFKAFDEIIDRYDLEKIKTIGDAYMCAGGLPSPDDQNATKAVQAALDMQAFLESWKESRINTKQPYFEARIGIHTGPIVAGVVGVKKFAYDIWGDTVNIASRMEANSEAGRVNISETTYQLVKGQFQFERRGHFTAKNQAEIGMYYVNSLGAGELASQVI